MLVLRFLAEIVVRSEALYVWPKTSSPKVLHYAVDRHATDWAGISTCLVVNVTTKRTRNARATRGTKKERRNARCPISALRSTLC